MSTYITPNLHENPIRDWIYTCILFELILIARRSSQNVMSVCYFELQTEPNLKIQNF